MNNTKKYIKIKSDGTPRGTTVTHIESGTVLRVSKINFNMTPNDIPQVELTIDATYVDFDIVSKDEDDNDCK